VESFDDLGDRDQGFMEFQNDFPFPQTSNQTFLFEFPLDCLKENSSLVISELMLLFRNNEEVKRKLTIAENSLKLQQYEKFVRIIKVLKKKNNCKK
jgi:hypothetical protein